MKKRESLLPDYTHYSAKAQSYEKEHRHTLNHSSYWICTYMGYSRVCFCASQHIAGKRMFILNSVLTPVMLPITESLDFFTPVLAKEMPFQEHLFGLHASLQRQHPAFPQAVCSQQPQRRHSSGTATRAKQRSEPRTGRNIC